MTVQGERVAMVTGGAGNIGRVIARTLAQDGCRVIVVDIDPAGEGVAQSLRAEGLVAAFVATDVIKEESVRIACARVGAEYGRLDYLVNNVGLLSSAARVPIETLPVETFDRVLATNLRSAFMFTKYCVTLLRATPGAAIVNVSSTKALMSMPDNEAYSTSKAGLLGLTVALANSLGPDVRVNAVCPGAIQTEANMRPGFPRPIDHSQHPVGRMGVPKDVADITRFLLSEQASFITGQAFVVDGGMAAKMVYAP